MTTTELISVWTCHGCGKMRRLTAIAFPIRCNCGAVTTDDRAIVQRQQVRTVNPVQKIKTYYSAIDRWVSAGRPVRTDEQVDAILSQHCAAKPRPCPYFLDSRCTHNLCGCQIRSSAGERQQLLSWLIPTAMLNKLRMATERCPDGRWS